MIHEVNLEFEIAVSAGDVRIGITIGDGQIGGTALFLDGHPIGPRGAITDLRIGDGQDLAGRALLARTLVADVNEATNWTSVRYTMSTPAALPPMTASREVENDQEAVRYNTTFRFVRGGE
jgi:hypothetical protein